MAQEYDFFISHASADTREAEQLHDALRGQSKVFLDRATLQPGDLWQKKIVDALDSSSVVVPLLSRNTADAHFQISEILRAIQLERKDQNLHRVMPVLLDSYDNTIPLGLEQFQRLSVATEGGLEAVARRLLKALRGRTAWEDYELLFCLAGYNVAYIPLINRLGDKIGMLSADDVKIRAEALRYPLPESFKKTAIEYPVFSDDPSCRVMKYSLEEAILSVTFSETRYSDFLKSGEHLDDPLPGEPTKTFRDVFGRLIHAGGRLEPFDLTNIAGVGVFVISQEERVLVSRHSNTSHIYPGRLTFSASGCMKWGAYPHPFSHAIVKCFQEIKHQVNPKKLKLVGFGFDARKLFFQFSFIERSTDDINEITGRSNTGVELISIPLDCESVVDALLSECWEPSAEAALLTLCVREFGQDRITTILQAKRAEWTKRGMRDEWDYRASRRGVLSVMSVRYPPEQLNAKSTNYVNAVMRFLGSDIRGKDVLEIGCGVGRVSKRLIKMAKRLTCLDLSDRMMTRCRNTVGVQTGTTRYVTTFAQDYPTQKHDVAICSLVLIHNASDAEFEKLVRKMCECADIAFVFEDVTRIRASSPHTRIRSREELKGAFAKLNFSLTNESTYRLSSDEIAFMRFARKI